MVKIPLWVAVAVLTAFLVTLGMVQAAQVNPKEVVISNGLIDAKLYLPDAQNGFYQGTRFDWSGVISSLKYKNHDYYGQWYDGWDPHVHDFIFRGNDIITSPCCKITGPVEDFKSNGSALGFDEARVGETFVKIGVGVLRKDTEKYDAFSQYKIVDGGKWMVKIHRDSVELTQEVADPSSRYAYLYRKVVRLTAGKPELVLEHSLKNTGRKSIRGTVYNHNFLTLDHQVSGPDFTVALPFKITSPQPSAADLMKAQGNRLVFLRQLSGHDVIFTPITGFGHSPKDNEVRIENTRVGAGLVMRGSQPLAEMYLWSLRSIIAVEPYIKMDIPPGGEFNWTASYDYYTLSQSGK